MAKSHLVILNINGDSICILNDDSESIVNCRQ